MNVEVNFLAVLLAGVGSMVVGMLWYGPILGKIWMKEKGITAQMMEEGKKEIGTTYAISFALNLLMAYMLTHVIAMSMNFFHYSPTITGISSALSMWLGFVVPVQATATLYGGRNWKLFGIDTGYQLLSLLAMGVILAAI